MDNWSPPARTVVVAASAIVVIIGARMAAHGSGDDAATDDAALLEAAGQPVALVPGGEANIKITWPEDLTPHMTDVLVAVSRTLPQTARMWAMLSDIAAQLTWHGLRLSVDDWKQMFLDGLKREARMVPNLNGDGFVNLGRSSSDLSVAEFGDLMTLIEAFGAQQGVVFHAQDHGRAA
jgi:hypothetical protein